MFVLVCVHSRGHVIHSNIKTEKQYAGPLKFAGFHNQSQYLICLNNGSEGATNTKHQCFFFILTFTYTLSLEEVMVRGSVI